MNDKIDVFLNEGLPTCILSILVVFAMLTLLIFAIVLLGKIISCFVDKAKSKEDDTPKQVSDESEKVKEEVAVTKSENDDLELIAVITAVIAAQMQTTTDRLVVKSLRKVERKTL